jgi:hypothetical protein
VGAILVVLIALVLIGWGMIRRALQRAAMAEAMNNIRSIKFALDGFATDFDGRYPDVETSLLVKEAGIGTRFSNDYFRQLFLSGETGSESLFWVKGSRITSKRGPDDRVSAGGKRGASLILQPGDCHWAYMTDQTNKSNPARALLLDPFLPGTTEFDPDLWDRKVIVVRVDGSAKSLRMRVSDNKALDESNHDILSPDADGWFEEKQNPMDFLVQPEPAP